MARFREMTSAPAESAGAETETRSAATALPDPGDAVASTRAAPSEGRVTIVGDGAKRNAFQRYREGYADLGNRLLNRDQSTTVDPFLEAGVDSQRRDFPATDALAPDRRPPARTPALEDSVARADMRPDRNGAFGTASLQRSTPDEGVARTAPPQPQMSRLEQLKAELRAQREGVATTQPTASPVVPDSTRGTLLSSPVADAGVARVSRDSTAERPLPSDLQTAAVGTAADSSASAAPKGPVEDTALRVQSMLASAEWLAERGDLEEAYRNAILAQHLAEYAGLTFDPLDRQPAEVSHRIWETIQSREPSSALALNLPRPQASSGPARQPVPQDAFPGSDRSSWQATEGSGSLVPLTGALPVIVPQGATPPAPAAPSPAASPAAAASPIPPAPPAAPAPAPAAAPAPAELPQVAQAPAANPVTLAAIDAEPKPPAAASAPSAPAPAIPQSDTPTGVVTALAEAAQRPRSDTASGLTVPAMASLPRVERGLPMYGPALGGPALARAEPVAAPPLLDVIGARQLPTEVSAASPDKSRRVYWILGGLTVLLLGAAYAFRRRWSAGASRAK